MTVRELLKDYEWFPQVVKNATIQGGFHVLEEEESSAANSLEGAFVWGDSPEGHEFWMNIHENLQQ